MLSLANPCLLLNAPSIRNESKPHICELLHGCRSVKTWLLPYWSGKNMFRFASFVLRDILLALIQYNSHLQVVQVSLGLAWASQEVDGSLIAEEEPGVTLQAKKHKLLSGTV
jgi:hypothetical protein